MNFGPWGRVCLTESNWVIGDSEHQLSLVLDFLQIIYALALVDNYTDRGIRKQMFFEELQIE